MLLRDWTVVRAAVTVGEAGGVHILIWGRVEERREGDGGGRAGFWVETDTAGGAVAHSGLLGSGSVSRRPAALLKNPGNDPLVLHVFESMPSREHCETSQLFNANY